MKVDKLSVNIYDTRAEMGAAAAKDIKNKFCELLETKPQINVIFAAAPSQNEVLAALVADKDIEWGRINAYHMDEYGIRHLKRQSNPTQRTPKGVLFALAGVQITERSGVIPVPI